MEVQLLSEMLTYFFFGKLEQNITELTAEKLDQMSKSIKQSTASINRKQLFDINLPSKLKKNMQRIASTVFEDMKRKESKNKWFVSAEAKLLKKKIPSLLDYHAKLMAMEDGKSAIENELESTEEKVRSEIRKRFCSVLGLKDLHASDEEIKILYELMVP